MTLNQIYLTAYISLGMGNKEACLVIVDEGDVVVFVNEDVVCMSIALRGQQVMNGCQHHLEARTKGWNSGFLLCISKNWFQRPDSADNEKECDC